jgi:N utilization substance protein A
VDPIGACIGHRGNRIQAVTGELGRERVDVILWDPTPREFIRNALSPAKVGLIEVNGDRKEASVTVTGDQLSLAIGKGGQNVRLAAKLTEFKIDLKETQAIQDLDAALAQAMNDEQEPRETTSEARAAFDALFADSKTVASATPEGDTELND